MAFFAFFVTSIVLYVLFYAVSTTLSSYLRRTLTATVDLREIGKPRKEGKIIGDALVCGGRYVGHTSVNLSLFD